MMEYKLDNIIVAFLGYLSALGCSNNQTALIYSTLLAPFSNANFIRFQVLPNS